MCCRCLGLSAHAIIFGGISHPLDPSDLSRCLTVSPAPPLHMRTRSPEWTALVEHWTELADMLAAEQPAGRAPRTYTRMRELIDNARIVGGQS